MLTASPSPSASLFALNAPNDLADLADRAEAAQSLTATGADRACTLASRNDAEAEAGKSRFGIDDLLVRRCLPEPEPALVPLVQLQLPGPCPCRRTCSAVAFLTLCVLPFLLVGLDVPRLVASVDAETVEIVEKVVAGEERSETLQDSSVEKEVMEAERDRGGRV